jgi:hypothetical protein
VSARDDLCAEASALSPRHQSQLRLLAIQAQRAATARRPLPARRWWEFSEDYAHPLELPIVRAALLGGE